MRIVGACAGEILDENPGVVLLDAPHLAAVGRLLAALPHSGALHVHSRRGDEPFGVHPCNGSQYFSSNPFDFQLRTAPRLASFNSVRHERANDLTLRPNFRSDHAQEQPKAGASLAQPHMGCK